MVLMHYYLLCVYTLFEFLSFDEFKFVKIVKRLGCRHGDDAPGGRMAALRAAGRPFLGGCARFMRPYMLCQFNAIQTVLVYMMNNIIL
jgi:hypothetical protein